MLDKNKIKGTLLHLNYGIIKDSEFKKSMEGIGFSGTDAEFKNAYSDLAKRVKDDAVLRERKAKRLKK